MDEIILSPTQIVAAKLIIYLLEHGDNKEEVLGLCARMMCHLDPSFIVFNNTYEARIDKYHAQIENLTDKEFADEVMKFLKNENKDE